jgi:hypothetical protein
VRNRLVIELISMRELLELLTTTTTTTTTKILTGLKITTRRHNEKHEPIIVAVMIYHWLSVCRQGTITK